MNPLDLPTSDDRLWAGLAYAGLGCLLIPTLLIFWWQREDSDFVRFHALQALGLGVITMGWWLITLLLWQLPLWLGMLFFLGGLGLLGYWGFLMTTAFMGKSHDLWLVGPWIRDRWM